MGSVSHTCALKVNEEGLEAVVQFCYTGGIDGVNGENVAAMLHASQRLQVESMTRALTAWMQENLNVQSATVVLAMADKLQLEALREEAMRFCLSHGSEVLSCESFRDLSFSLVREVLESGQLRVESELEVLQATSRWVRHKPEERKSHILPLLKGAARLLVLSVDDLVAYAESDAMVQESQEAQQVVIKAVKYVGMTSARRVELLKMPLRPARRARMGCMPLVGP